jgi:hypothetical protein
MWARSASGLRAACGMCAVVPCVTGHSIKRSGVKSGDGRNECGRASNGEVVNLWNTRAPHMVVRGAHSASLRRYCTHTRRVEGLQRRTSSHLGEIDDGGGAALGRDAGRHRRRR